MSPPVVWLKLSLLTSIQAVVIFSPNSVAADFSDSCVNSTNSTSCIRTYEQLYNSLAKSENSFNIESALYPAKRPSSVRVSVNIYGPNKTKDTTEPVARYTWSISCLYAAIPATLLEILSLGSILVTPRTQDLSIQIPFFCCNVSDKDNNRRAIIKEMIEGVLAALQDLAVSPGIRDPRLNTAECVIEGHKTDIGATGHNIFITLMLWSSACFTFVSCPLLAYFFEECRKKAWPENKNKTESHNTGTQQNTGNETPRRNEIQGSQGNKESEESEEKIKRKEEKKRKEENTAKAVCILCLWLTITGTLILIAAFIVSIVYCAKRELRADIPLIPISNFIVSFSVFCWRKCKFGDKRYSLRFTICATTTSYFVCWLLIGIMINPIWGLTVTLLIGLFWAAFTYAIYQYFTAPSSNKDQSCFSCVCFVLAVIFLVLVVVFAGQSYNGRETADETMKTVLLYVIGALVSWLSWKRHSSAKQPIQAPSLEKSARNGPGSSSVEMAKLMKCSPF